MQGILDQCRGSVLFENEGSENIGLWLSRQLVLLRQALPPIGDGLQVA